MKKLIIAVITTASLFFGLAPAWAETDPFPGVEHMNEIPGTRVSSPAGFTQAQWEATETYQSFIASGCPAGSGNAVSVNVSEKIWSNYCVKTWRPQSVIDAWQKYYADEQAARDSAYQQSLAWNTANPGQQKCFQWGPLTSPEGGVSSGGVCANPVYSAAASSESVTREPEVVFESTRTSERVSTFVASFSQVPNLTKKSLVGLPKFKNAKKLGLKVSFSSLKPKVCSVEKTRVRFLTAGTCSIRLTISDQAGNKTRSKLQIAKS